MSFWEAYGWIFGWIFLICVTVFPRITMLLVTSAPFGCLAWIGWIFLPRLTVAIFATVYYGSTNPILCVVAWFVAFFGELAEKIGIGKVANR